MRGRFHTWTRIRVNLQHVPEPLRPAQEALDPDAGPDLAAEWEAAVARGEKRSGRRDSAEVDAGGAPHNPRRATYDGRATSERRARARKPE